MSDKSLIEWTDATWNPVRGCEKVSPGCKHCYAEVFAERFRGVPGNAYEQGFDPRLAPEMLEQPLRWQRPRTVFVNSMSDLFGEFVPDDYIAAVFGVMAASLQHTFQVLTKRADRLPRWFRYVDQRAVASGPHARVGVCMNAMGQSEMSLERHAQATRSVLSIAGRDDPWPLPNVWLGVSVEDRKYGLPRIEHLRQTPAAVRFLSIEPLLGDLGDITPALLGLREVCSTCRAGQSRSCFNAANTIGPPMDWVIVGGESGPGARPMHPEWVRSIRDQCIAAGVPFFFKHWGQWSPPHGDPRQGDIWLLSDGGQIAASPGPLVAIHAGAHRGPARLEGEPRGPERAVLMRRHRAKHDAGRVLDGRTWDEMPPRPA